MEKPLLTYGRVEEMLAALHGAGDYAGALVGRIKYLRKHGLPFGLSPGSGNKISYRGEHFFQFAFCLDLEQCGVDPALAVRLLKAHRPYVLQAYFNAGKAAESYFFWLSAEFMTASWKGAKLKFPGVPEMGAGPIRALTAAIDGQRRMIVFPLTPCIRMLKRTTEAENGDDTQALAQEREGGMAGGLPRSVRRPPA